MDTCPECGTDAKHQPDCSYPFADQAKELADVMKPVGVEYYPHAYDGTRVEINVSDRQSVAIRPFGECDQLDGDAPFWQITVCYDDTERVVTVTSGPPRHVAAVARAAAEEMDRQQAEMQHSMGFEVCGGAAHCTICYDEMEAAAETAHEAAQAADQAAHEEQIAAEELQER